MEICQSCQQPLLKKSCLECKHLGPEDANYCPKCGSFFISNLDDGDFDDRINCSDGNCVGILDSEGKCVVCGKR